MPRKLRLEYPGAIYHVINRGNYRAWIFADDATQAAFEQCLFAACVRSGWILHAFVIMGNHFHLALETPEANLVAGMQWLQSTFAARFNRCRRERGHLFQGRYKSLLVQPGNALGQVCNYLHLNPVRAGLSTVQGLRDYRHSSYWYLWRPRCRPSFLHASSALAEAGGLADQRPGWIAYEHFLAWQATEGPAGRNAAYVTLSRGWVLGTEDFKKHLLDEHDPAPITRAWERSGAEAMRRRRWQAALDQSLERLAKVPADCRADRKSAPWKIAVAIHLKRTTQAGNAWLNERLRMGSAVAVSQYASIQMRGRGLRYAEIQRLIEGLNT